MLMNEHDVDEMLYTAQHDLPEVLPYAQYLSDWKDTINANSDGWAYWAAGHKSAKRLMELLQEAKATLRNGGKAPPKELFDKALTPIKSMATKRGLTAPELIERPAQDGGGLRF